MSSPASHRSSRRPFAALLRVLAPWRTRTRFGRATAVVLAMAMALLMAGTAAPTYAADTAPTDPAATGTPSDPAASDPVASDPATSDPAASDPAATDPAASDPATSGGTTGSSGSASKKSAKTTTTSGFQSLAAVPAAGTAPDWIWQGGAPTETDGLGDSGGYTNGASEGDDPSGWNGGNSSSPKNDIDKFYFDVDNSTGDVLASFGFTRSTDNGDTGFSVEFNQASNLAAAAPRPNRTEGDLLLKFFKDSGSAPLAFAHAFIWLPQSKFAAHELTYLVQGFKCQLINGTAAGWCEIPRAGFQGRVSDDNLTAEGRVNLTTLFGAGNQGCSAEFHNINMRSTASSENWTNALQDYVTPETRVIPSTCATLVIKKFENGTTTLVTGAHYDVYSGTTATGLPAYADVYDGKAGVDDDNNATNGSITLTQVEPGTYTVKETTAPPGYFLNTTVCTAAQSAVDPNLCGTQTKTVAKSATATYSFYDVKQWQDLVTEKTATASYSASYAWSIDKQVATSETGPWTDAGAGVDSAQTDNASGSETFFYRVAVTAGAKTPSGYKVTGVIRVKNPNSSPVQVSLSDSLPGSTCSLDGTATPTVPGDNAFHGYAYTCTGAPTDLTGDNTATVSWSQSAYPQSMSDFLAGGSYSKSPTAGYDFTAAAAETSSTDKTIHVTDTKHTFTPDPYAVTWTAEGDVTALPVYSRPLNVGAGTCATDGNTATITETKQADSTTVKVCHGADLQVTKGATASLVRTYPWSISKSTSTPRIDVDDQGKATASYTVTVTAGDRQDSQWHLSGSVVVANPNDWEAVSVTDVTDVYSGGGSCTITGVKSGADFVAVTFPHSIPASGSKEFSYDCTFATQPSTYTGTNTATASWSAAAAATPHGSASGDYTLKDGDTETAISGTNDWAKTLVNADVTVVDDHATPSDATDDTSHPLSWATVHALPDHRTTLSYTIDLAVPDAGTCADRVNTVKVVGTNGAILDADGDSANNSATVKVCRPLTLTGAKTATPSFTRTYDWAVVKEVKDPSTGQWVDAATFTDDQYTHTFDYRVVVKRDGFADSAWTMSGSITVTNPNTDASIPAITAAVSEPTTIGGAAATCTINGVPGPAVVTVASDDSTTLSYVCTLAGAPTAGTRNVATITWGQGQGQSATATSDQPGLTYDTPTTEVDESTTVVDDGGTPGLVNSADDTTLGTVTWAQAGADGHTFATYQTSHTATSTGCSTANTWVNTATAYGDDTEAALGSDTATAAICPVAATWTVAKNSNPADGTRIEPGTDLTYSLTVAHTGGVPATGVVVVDDLSQLVPAYADYTGLAPASAGEAGNVTAPSTGNGQKLTWDAGTVSAGSPKTLSFVVHVAADAWDVNLHNLVTPGPDTTGGSCIPATQQDAAPCETDHHTTAKPLLTLVKNVLDNGTGADDPASAWDLSADGPGTASDVAAVKSGTQTAVLPGDYALSEADGPTGYTKLGWKCDNDTAYRAGESITLASDQTAVCTVTNQAIKPTLRLVKSVNNDNGGTGVTTDWKLAADGPVDFDADGDTGVHAVQVGSYALSETSNPNAPAGYVNGTTWNCGTKGAALTSVTLGLGEDVVCTITNVAQTSTWTINKSSNPGDGATVTPGQEITWTLSATKTSGVDPVGVVLQDVLADVLANTNGVTAITPEVGSASIETIGGVQTLVWTIPSLSGTKHLTFKAVVADGKYGVTFSNVVTSQGSSGCTEDCDTVHHTPAFSLDKSTDGPERVAPGATLTYHLTVVNTSDAQLEGAQVTDDLGGLQHTDTPQVTGMTWSKAGAAPAPSTTLTGDPQKLTWTVPDLGPGQSAVLTYTLHVKSDAYGVTIGNHSTAGDGGHCVPATENDPEPCDTTHTTKDKPTLTLVKVVDTGEALASAFTLKATGPETVQGPGAGDGSVDGAPVLPGTYALSETGPKHYTASDWTCVDNGELPTSHAVTSGDVALALDQHVTCTIHNSAVATGYDVAKTSEITAKPGPDGTVLPGGTVAYTLTANWLDGVAGKPVVIEDDLTDVLLNASLDGVPAGAELVTRTVGGAPHQILVWTIAELGETTTPATLHYTITVDEDDAAWGQHLVNVVTPVTTGGSCVPGKCSTDTPTPPKPVLTLVKHVTNGLGGTAVVTDWTVAATKTGNVNASQGAFSGAGGHTDGVWPGTYDLDEALTSEDGPQGYSSSGWTCSNNEGTVDQVTMVVGQDVTCDITNTQDAVWTLSKSSSPSGVVVPGQDVTYTITATHTAGVNPSGIVVHDDLTDVLAHAVMQTSFPAASGAATLSGNDLTWTVPTFVTGTDVQTLQYTVKVKDTAKGVTLRNGITSDAGHCPSPTVPGCSTSNPVPIWTLRKDSDPVDGQTVAGNTPITYTLKVTNTSQSAALVGATVVDDLSGVLANASMVTSFPTAGATYDATPNAEKIRWQVPTLQPGASTTLSYTVKVNASYAAGTVLHNVSAVGPVDSEHPVNRTGSCETTPEGSKRASQCETTVGTEFVEPPVVETPGVLPEVLGPKPIKNPTLPSTGGPVAMLVPGGTLLVMLGAGLVLVDRRRRRAA